MKKIFYFMHVPWGWAKQRPHFIAEYLSQYFDVTVFYEKQYIGKKQLLNRFEIPLGITLNELFKLPFPDHHLFTRINSFLTTFQIKKGIDKYDIIWLTYPKLFTDIKSIIPIHSKLIYDCMDNALEFPLVKSNVTLCRNIFNDEKELVERSHIIFASSDYLKKILIERHGVKKDICVVNNAIHLEKEGNLSESLNPSILSQISSAFQKKRINLSYIGTISEWIDFELILKSLHRYDNINYIFWGPCEKKMPNHERIIHAGPVEHKYIYEIMDKSDALMMPFEVNELIRSVDPIKLYEYIYAYKPAIVVDYKETHKFKDYVHLYQNENVYLSLLKKLIDSKLHFRRSLEEHRAFSYENTWDKRIRSIVHKMTE